MSGQKCASQQTFRSKPRPRTHHSSLSCHVPAHSVRVLLVGRSQHTHMATRRRPGVPSRKSASMNKLLDQSTFLRRLLVAGILYLLCPLRVVGWQAGSNSASAERTASSAVPRMAEASTAAVGSDSAEEPPVGCMQLFLRSEDMNEASRLVKYGCGSTNLVPRHFGPNRKLTPTPAASQMFGIKSITARVK